MTDKTQEEKKADYEAYMERIQKEVSEVKTQEDFIEYLRRNNRHTLKVSLLNEQTGEEEWAGREITFLNEDNAISHLEILGKFYDLLLENKHWGYKQTTDEVVDNILNPIRKHLKGEANG